MCPLANDTASRTSTVKYSSAMPHAASKGMYVWVRVTALLAVGYPEEPLPEMRSRKRLDKVLFFEQWRNLPPDTEENGGESWQ